MIDIFFKPFSVPFSFETQVSIYMYIYMCMCIYIYIYIETRYFNWKPANNWKSPLKLTLTYHSASQINNVSIRIRILYTKGFSNAYMVHGNEFLVYLYRTQISDKGLVIMVLLWAGVIKMYTNPKTCFMVIVSNRLKKPGSNKYIISVMIVENSK